MNELITYTQARKKISTLQNYIDLIDHYDENSSLESWVIKKFALTNSISKVIKLSNSDNSPFTTPLTRDYIRSIILSDKQDDQLQASLKKAYSRRYIKKTVK